MKNIIPISVAIENLSDDVINVELFKDVSVSAYNGGDYFQDDVSIKAGGSLNYQQLMYIFKMQSFDVGHILALNFGNNIPNNYSDLVIKNQDKEDILLEPTKKLNDGNLITSPYFDTQFTIEYNTRIYINNLKPKSLLVILFYPATSISIK